MRSVFSNIYRNFVFLLLIGLFVSLFDLVAGKLFSRLQIEADIRADLKDTHSIIQNFLDNGQFEDACNLVKAQFFKHAIVHYIITGGELSCSEPKGLRILLTEHPNVVFPDTHFGVDVIDIRGNSGFYSWVVSKKKFEEKSIWHNFSASDVLKMASILEFIKTTALVLLLLHVIGYVLFRIIRMQLGVRVDMTFPYNYLDRIFGSLRFENLLVVGNIIGRLHKNLKAERDLNSQDSLSWSNYVKKELKKDGVKSELKANATIVYADISGYTELSTKHPDIALQARDRLEDFKNEGLTRHKGYKEPSRGDDVVAIFIGEDHLERAIAFSIDLVNEVGSTLFHGVNLRNQQLTLKVGIAQDLIISKLQKSGVDTNSKGFIFTTKLVSSVSEEEKIRSLVLIKKDDLQQSKVEFFKNSIVSDRALKGIGTVEIVTASLFNQISDHHYANREFRFFLSDFALISHLNKISMSERSIAETILKDLREVSVIHVPLAVLNAWELAVHAALKASEVDANWIIELTKLIVVGVNFGSLDWAKQVRQVLDSIPLKRSARLNAEAVRLLNTTGDIEYASKRKDDLISGPGAGDHRTQGEFTELYATYSQLNETSFSALVSFLKSSNNSDDVVLKTGIYYSYAIFKMLKDSGRINELVANPLFPTIIELIGRQKIEEFEPRFQGFIKSILEK